MEVTSKGVVCGRSRYRYKTPDIRSQKLNNGIFQMWWLHDLHIQHFRECVLSVHQDDMSNDRIELECVVRKYKTDKRQVEWIIDTVNR